MQAVHSSSALGVDIFQYWQKLNQVPVIAAACGLCLKSNNVSNKIVFKVKISNRASCKSLFEVKKKKISSIGKARAKVSLRKKPKHAEAPMKLKQAVSWLIGTLQRNLIPWPGRMLRAAVNPERAPVS